MNGLFASVLSYKSQEIEPIETLCINKFLTTYQATCFLIGTSYTHQNKLFSQQVRAAGEEFTRSLKNKKEPEMSVDMLHEISQQETQRLESYTDSKSVTKKCNLM